MYKVNKRCLLKSRKLQANLTDGHRSKNPKGTLTNGIQQCIKMNLISIPSWYYARNKEWFKL